MKDLIEALNIFLKYTDTRYPTHCSHDQLSIMEVEEGDVSKEDIQRLDELGFFWSESDDCFISFRFGSAQVNPIEHRYNKGNSDEQR